MNELRMSAVDILNCLDCGADLSDRGVSARRCVNCQGARHPDQRKKESGPILEYLTKGYHHRSEVPTAVWRGTFAVLGVDVHCYVMEDGHRMVEASSKEGLLSALDAKADTEDDPAVVALTDWLRGDGPVSA